jgi:hypothetical protein
MPKTPPFYRQRGERKQRPAASTMTTQRLPAGPRYPAKRPPFRHEQLPVCHDSNTERPGPLRGDASTLRASDISKKRRQEPSRGGAAEGKTFTSGAATKEIPLKRAARDHPHREPSHDRRREN